MMQTKRSFGTRAPRMSVVSLNHAGPWMYTGSVPQIPSNSATAARERPSVTSTCSMWRW